MILGVLNSRKSLEGAHTPFRRKDTPIALNIYVGQDRMHPTYVK